MNYEEMTDEDLKRHAEIRIRQVKAGIKLSAVEDVLSNIENEQNRRNEKFKYKTIYNEDGSLKQTQITNMETTIAEVVDYEGGKPVHSACFNVDGDVVRTATFHDNGDLHKESYYKDNKNIENIEYALGGGKLKSDHAVEGKSEREFVQYLDNKPIGAVVLDENEKMVRSSNFTTEGKLREVKNYDENGNVVRTREYENDRLTSDSNDNDDNGLVIGHFEWIDVQNRNGENAKYLDLGQFENETQETMVYEALYNAGIDFETKTTSLSGSSGRVISVTDPKAIEIINNSIETGGISKPESTPVVSKATNNVKMGM